MTVSTTHQPIHGTNFDLTCTAVLTQFIDSDHTVMFEWYRNNQLLESTIDGRIMVSETTLTSGGFIGTLSYRPLGSNSVDGGNYTCRASVMHTSVNRDYIGTERGDSTISIDVQGNC